MATSAAGSTCTLTYTLESQRGGTTFTCTVEIEPRG